MARLLQLHSTVFLSLIGCHSWSLVSADKTCYSCVTVGRGLDGFYWQTLGLARLPATSTDPLCGEPVQGVTAEASCPTDCYEILVQDASLSTTIWARGCRTDLVAEAAVATGDTSYCESGTMDGFLVNSINPLFVQSRVCSPAPGSERPCNDNREKLTTCHWAPKPKSCWKCEDAGCDKSASTCDGPYCYNLTSSTGGNVQRTLAGCSPISLIQKDICYDVEIQGDTVRRCFCDGKECNLQNSAPSMARSLSILGTLLATLAACRWT